MTTPAVVVSISDLNVFAQDKQLIADLTLSVKDGERVVIIGSNGAGKTTLLRVLTGMIIPSSGNVTVLGQQVSGRTPANDLRLLRARVGQVFQGLHLVGRPSVLNNVLIGALGRQQTLLTCGRIFPQEEIESAQAALNVVGMSHAAQMRVDSLSGGERQKVAVARALNQNPQIILADEPTASLDPLAAEEIADLLTRITEERHLTLITVAHTLKLLPNLAQRVVGMKAGRIEFDLPINQIGGEQLRRFYEIAPPVVPRA